MSNKRIETDGEQMLTVAEAARFLGRTEAAIRALVRVGKAPPYFKIHDYHLRFPVSGLVEFQRRRNQLREPEPRAAASR